MGRDKSCDNFVVPESQYIRQVQLAYNTMGVTYLKITTSQGGSFSRGTLQQTDHAYTQYFTEERPFMGLVGYQSNVLKALGFVTFLCKDGLPGEEDHFANNSTHTEGLVPGGSPQVGAS